MAGPRKGFQVNLQWYWHRHLKIAIAVKIFRLMDRGSRR